MAKYLIQNTGEAIHMIMVRNEAVDLMPGQGIVETLNQGEAKRLEHSVGLRLTLREEPKAEPSEPAPTPTPKPKAKPPTKPKLAVEAPVAEQPQDEPTPDTTA